MTDNHSSFGYIDWEQFAEVFLSQRLDLRELYVFYVTLEQLSEYLS